MLEGEEGELMPLDQDFKLTVIDQEYRDYKVKTMLIIIHWQKLLIILEHLMPHN